MKVRPREGPRSAPRKVYTYRASNANGFWSCYSHLLRSEIISSTYQISHETTMMDPAVVPALEQRQLKETFFSGGNCTTIGLASKVSAIGN